MQGCPVLIKYLITKMITLTKNYTSVTVLMNQNNTTTVQNIVQNPHRLVCVLVY